MKLYLSSYLVGNDPKKLQELVGPNKRVAVILNAVDHKSSEIREERLRLEFASMYKLGFEPEEVDLRDYFDKDPVELEKELSQFGFLWIRGGNVFVLRKAMHLSGFDQIVRHLLDKGVVYAGYSAASCAAGPTLHGIELCDDINLVPPNYPSETIWEGLDLIDYVIAPHYKSDHPESPMIDEVVEYLHSHNLPYKTLHDGEVIIVND
jgi:dipeptidase E